MTKNKKKLAWDKQQHFGAGLAISIIAGIAAGALHTLVGLPILLVVLIITITPLFAGYFKEVLDKKEPGNRFDFWDMLATWLGALPMIAAAWYIYLTRI